MGDEISRRNFLRITGTGIAAAAVGVSQGNADQPTTPQADPGFGWGTLAGKDALVIRDPGRRADAGHDEVKLIIQGNRAVVRSKNRNPATFNRNWIDPRERVEILPFNTVIAYEGTDAANPLSVIFHSGAMQQVRATTERPGTYTQRTNDHSGAHLTFIGRGRQQSAVELDMRPHHGQWNSTFVPTTVEFSNVTPHLILSPDILTHGFRHTEGGTYFADDQMEIIPADSAGTKGSVLLCIPPAAARSYDLHLHARGSNERDIAHGVVGRACDKRDDFEAVLQRLHNDTNRALRTGQAGPAPAATRIACEQGPARPREVLDMSQLRESPQTGGQTVASR